MIRAIDWFEKRVVQRIVPEAGIPNLLCQFGVAIFFICLALFLRGRI